MTLVMAVQTGQKQGNLFALRAALKSVVARCIPLEQDAFHQRRNKEVSARENGAVLIPLSLKTLVERHYASLCSHLMQRFIGAQRLFEVKSQVR